MFLCSSCHTRSTCRSEVHLDIVRKKCEGCGFLASCFNCSKITIIDRRAIHAPVTVAQYRHTKLLRPYRKITF